MLDKIDKDKLFALTANLGKLDKTNLSAFLKDFSKLDEFAENPKLIDAWKFLDGSTDTRKMTDYLKKVDEILSSNTWSAAEIAELKGLINGSTTKKNLITDISEAAAKNTSKADLLIIARSGSDNRLRQAQRLADAGLNFAADAVKNSSNANAILKNFIRNLSSAEFDSKVLTLYMRDPVLHARLTVLSNKLKNGGNITEIEITAAFAGYEAHHIVAVNRVWNTAGFDKALNTDPDFLNSFDNLIFLESPRIHQGSHPDYDDLIGAIINGKSMKKVREDVAEVKTKMETTLIYTNTKINNFKP
jgi:hypothetical protein